MARNHMNKSIEDAAKKLSIHVLNFDLQKILVTTKAQVSNMYYMSRLCVYNLTIYDLHRGTIKCNIWNETVAQRGSNEIASILMGYIIQKISKNPAMKEIRTFSDDFSGQNKNQNVFTMFFATAMRYNIKITHR